MATKNAILAMETFIPSKSTIDRLYYGTAFAFVCIRDARIYSSIVSDSRAVQIPLFNSHHHVHQGSTPRKEGGRVLRRWEYQLAAHYTLWATCT